MIRTILFLLVVPLLAGCAVYQLPPPEPLTLEDIIAMSATGKTPGEIIAEIEKSRTLYDLRTEDILQLTEGGVDPRVIDYMLEAHQRALYRDRYRYAYPYYYDPWWYGPPPYPYYW